MALSNGDEITLQSYVVKRRHNSDMYVSIINTYNLPSNICL